jgi:peptidoglycan/LPS O-acetylase OafA/YrhL
VLVLLSHISLIIGEPRFYGRPPFDGAFAKFGAGVDFFFVLSGFIIAWIHWGDVGRPMQLRHYVVRRIQRIYPPYWGVLLPLSLLYFLSPSSGVPSQHDAANFVASLLLFPYPEHPILGVAWTLVYEVVFYTLFGLLILIGRGVFWLLGLWSVAILVANLTFNALAYPLTILLDVRNLQFLLGILAALWVREGTIPLPRLMTVVGAALFLAQLLVVHPVLDDPLVGRIGFGIAAATAIVGVVGWERGARLPIGAGLRLLGVASYSIYLIHGIAISAAIQIVTRVLPRDVPLVIPVIALAIAGITAGVLYHLAVERPLTRWIDGWRWLRSARAPEPTRAGHVG